MTDEERMLKEQEILNLTADLSSAASPVGDWKLEKINEYLAVGKPAPYDIQELHTKRQAIRDRINELQEELKK